MIKGAIFDVDGTLLDSMKIWEDVGARYVKSRGLIPEQNLGEILFPMSLTEGGVYLKEHYFPNETVEAMIAGVLNVIEEFYLNEVQLKPGAKDLLEKLSDFGIPMAIATSSDRRFICKAFERLGVLSYFKEMFTCTEVGASKKNPLIYHKAAESIGTKPEETLVFEDVLHAIETASKAGYQCVAVYDEASEKDKNAIKSNAKFYFETYSEENIENFFQLYALKC